MFVYLEPEMFRSQEEAFYAGMLTAVHIAIEQLTLLITCSLNLVVAETLGRTLLPAAYVATTSKVIRL
jgi:hypothetical protein